MSFDEHPRTFRGIAGSRVRGTFSSSTRSEAGTEWLHWSPAPLGAPELPTPGLCCPLHLSHSAVGRRWYHAEHLLCEPFFIFGGPLRSLVHLPFTPCLCPTGVRGPVYLLDQGPLSDLCIAMGFLLSAACLGMARAQGTSALLPNDHQASPENIPSK